MKKKQPFKTIIQESFAIIEKKTEYNYGKTPTE